MRRRHGKLKAGSARLIMEYAASTPRVSHYPDDLHPMDGYLLVARQYGMAVDHLRTWQPRRGEIVYHLRSKGVSMGKIATLLRVSRRTVYRWNDQYLEAARKFNELLDNPESVMPT